MRIREDVQKSCKLSLRHKLEKKLVTVGFEHGALDFDDAEAGYYRMYTNGNKRGEFIYRMFSEAPHTHLTVIRSVISYPENKERRLAGDSVRGVSELIILKPCAG